MEYKFYPNSLEQLVHFGFKINWTLLQIGYLGCDFIPSVFTKGDISSYALNQLESTDDILVAMLADTNNTEYEFERILERLARNEDVNVDNQIRKLRVLILFRHFRTLPYDYTDGLIELTEIWISLGLPNDCPHIIQGRGNSLSPSTYYTKEMYETLKKRNIDWLDNEISYIKKQEN